MKKLFKHNRNGFSLAEMLVVVAIVVVLMGVAFVAVQEADDRLDDFSFVEGLVELELRELADDLDGRVGVPVGGNAEPQNPHRYSPSNMALIH